MSIAGPTRQVKPLIPVATVALRWALVAVVAFVRGIGRLDHAAVRGGSAWRLVGVLAKLWIDAVDAGGDRLVARGEGHAPEVLAPDAPVVVVVALTAAFAGIDELLTPGL